MPSLREQIHRLYREDPYIGAQQILERTGHKPTPEFWRILESVQIALRGTYPGKRRNMHVGYKYRERQKELYEFDK
jgi:hypothetical protein